jgi:hypothetical protein
MTINKQTTVANPQLISGSGDSMRDTLGLSIGSDSTSKFVESFVISEPSVGLDGIRRIYTYAYRLTGDGDSISSDKQWQAYVYGGEYADENYPGIFLENTFADHHHVEQNPYSETEVKENGTYTTMSPNFVSCKPEINSYYPLYEASLQGLVDVTAIPNAYKILDSDDASMEEQIKLGLPGVNQTASFLKNVFVVDDDVYGQIEQLNNSSGMLPYYIKTELNFEPTGDFLLKVTENNFQYRFIKILKDSFLGEDGAPLPIEAAFNISNKQINSLGEPEETIQNLALKVVDAYDMMNYSLVDYNTSVDNFEYLFDDSEAATSQYDDKSIKRFEKTIPTLKQTNSLIEFLDSPKYLNTFKGAPLNLDQKYNEVVAYRIEKIGGPPTDDAFTQEAIQNFWFLNTDDVERFIFLDNQVAFGQDYTYNIYKYVLIAGIEYSYSNLAITRTIANLEPNWCLEFFDPITGNEAAPLYDDGPNGVESIENELATDAQVTSESQYLADFMLTVSPSIKIVEIPLLTKGVSILDAPANLTQVQPSYLLDNSNTLHFMVRYNTFVPAKFPTPITSADAEYEQRFLESYDFLENELITVESKTLPITLEIYRTEVRPKSLQDFDGNLLATRNMKVPNEQAAFTTISFYDKVAANKKYFYLFRILNEVQNMGTNSNIIEAELISDGGYKFAKFEAYFENELDSKTSSRTIKSFKKLLNISPNIQNIVVDDSNADYSDQAENQIQNISFGQSDDPVWDKKFKIRLTSKKTGKKIDINITHKLVG